MPPRRGPKGWMAGTPPGQAERGTAKSPSLIHGRVRINFRIPGQELMLQMLMLAAAIPGFGTGQI